MFLKNKFSPCINLFKDLVKQQASFKLELDSKNEEVVMIIPHDLEGVEKAPSATVLSGQSEAVNSAKKLIN